MPIDWKPATDELQQRIDAELARFNQLKQQKQVETTPVWQPPIPQTPNFTPPVMQPAPVVQPITPTGRIAPAPPIAPQVVSPITPPVPPVNTAVDYTNPLYPFQVPEDLPLWAKTLNVIGKPFELVQQYLFNPLLAAIHLPFTRQLTPDEEKTANQQGIMSYFPGGIRHQAYEELQYPMKWAVEMLPWLLVPAIGTVGRAGTLAGGLAKLGKAGEIAGKALEMSPYGLAEKGTNALVGKLTGIIKSASTKLPEQTAMTHELRVQQLQKALPELQTGGGEDALRRFMNSLKGEAQKVDFENVAQKLSISERNQLADMIRTSPNLKGFDFASASSGWKKILDGKLPVDSELEQLQKVFGADMVQALIDKKPGNIITKISDIANAPRAVLSAVDLSGLLRQGAILTTRHPLEALKTVKPMLKSFLSDNNAKLVNDVIQARPNTALGAEHGLYLAPEPGAGITPLSKMEESFMSKWIESVPVIGPLVKASNRTYVTVLNDLRSRSWEATIKSWQGQTIGEADYKNLARLVNSASGRGSLPKALQGASPLFNATLFSPRLFISRIQFPMMWMPGVNASPLARKEAARMLVQFLGAGTAILGMAKVAGAHIEPDPRSADFGKIKIGNTRLDIWTGYTQWARFMAQLTTASRKTQYGNFTELNRRDVVDRFLQSKYSPAMGLINDMLRGESYGGEQLDLNTSNVQRQAYMRLMPLFLQDMIDAIDQEGLIGGTVALPGLFGVGVVTYLSPANKMREQLSQEKYGMSWEQVGTKYGLAAQQDLERSNPKLLAEVEKERQDYNQTITGKSDVGNIYRNQTSTIESEYKRQIDLATQEYRDTGDGYTFKEKIMKIADNRRSQYDVLNADPQFAKITAKYNELPSASDLKNMSPQDFARKWYMSMLYGKDMYDQYGNYRFDMVDDVKDQFVQTFGQAMLDYVEQYQGIKEADMSPEYKQFKEAQKVLKPYWVVQDEVEKIRGTPTTKYQLKVISAMVSRIRKRMRAENPQLDAYYRQYYSQSQTLPVV